MKTKINKIQDYKNFIISKKSMLTIALVVLAAGTIFIGCMSSGEKVDDAKTEVQNASQNLNEVINDTLETAQRKAANAEEWNAFKSESEVKIKNNELRIAELKLKMKKSGNEMEAAYEKSINTLEQKNTDLKVKMEAYKNDTQNDWESFKREYNHDIDELGKALKDLTVNNKK